jgi:hypothetical protein
MLNNIAMSISGNTDRSRGSEAISLYRYVLQQRNHLYKTEENADSVATMNNLGWLLLHMGRPADALLLLECVYAFRKRCLGESIATWNAGQNVALALVGVMKERKSEESESEKEKEKQREELSRVCGVMEEVCKGKMENIGITNPSTLRSIEMHISFLQMSGNDEEFCRWNRIYYENKK